MERFDPSLSPRDDAMMKARILYVTELLMIDMMRLGLIEPPYPWHKEPVPEPHPVVPPQEQAETLLEIAKRSLATAELIISHIEGDLPGSDATP